MSTRLLFGSAPGQFSTENSINELHTKTRVGSPAESGAFNSSHVGTILRAEAKRALLEFPVVALLLLDSRQQGRSNG